MQIGGETYRREIAELRRRPAVAGVADGPGPTATTDDSSADRPPEDWPSSEEAARRDDSIAATLVGAGRRGLSCWPVLRSRPVPVEATDLQRRPDSFRRHQTAAIEVVRVTPNFPARNGLRPECRKKGAD